MSDQFVLKFEREIEVPPEFVFRAWTEPEIMVNWFTPRPWRCVSATAELRHGGAFLSEMAGPDGESNSVKGCVLDFEIGKKLVWTNLMSRDFLPQAVADDGFGFVAWLEFLPTKTGGTNYRATLYHDSAASKDLHESLGFEAGWGAALDQLVELFLVGNGASA